MKTKKQIIAPAAMYKAERYAHAVKVGNMLFIAGQPARDKNFNIVGKGDIAVQTAQVFENIKSIVEEAGGTMENIVALTTYFTNIKDFPKYREVREKYIKPESVAATTMAVTALVHPDMIVEVEGIAIID